MDLLDGAASLIRPIFIDGAPSLPLCCIPLRISPSMLFIFKNLIYFAIHLLLCDANGQACRYFLCFGLCAFVALLVSVSVSMSVSMSLMVRMSAAAQVSLLMLTGSCGWGTGCTNSALAPMQYSYQLLLYSVPDFISRWKAHYFISGKKISCRTL